MRRVPRHYPSSALPTTRLTRTASRRAFLPLVATVVVALGASAGCSGGSDRSDGAEPTGTTGAATGGSDGGDDQPVATDPPRPTATDVVLGFLSWNPETSAVEAGGYVSPVVEAGGTCTLELSDERTTVTATVDAVPDATTTVCGGLTVAGTELRAGEWTAVLSYTSSSTSGDSRPLTVEVPE